MKKTLKLMAMLLCVVSLASLSSCSKENNSDGSNDQIIGKWKCTHSVVQEFDIIEGGLVTQTDSEVGMIWEFKTGNTVVTDGRAGAYTISDNDITLMGGIVSGKIVSLTSTNLTLDLKGINHSYNGVTYVNSYYYEFSKM